MVYCTLYTIHSFYTVLYLHNKVYCTLYTIHSFYSVLYLHNKVYCTLYTVQCIQNIASMMYSIYIIRYTVNPLARWGVRGDHKKNVEIHEIKVAIIINRNIFFDSFTGV